jgi:uncharacterized protein YndB with AHSA1/START domain
MEMTTEQSQIFTISKTYDAPRNLVWSCFTSAEHLRHWWGPKGIEIVNSRLDFRVGGQYHYGMQSPDGGIMWGRFMFREIVAPEKIVFINSFSDEAGGLTRAPFFDGKWPLEVLSTFLFEEVTPGKTKFTVIWTPENANTAEREVFAANLTSARGGWTGTLEKLGDYLATTKN